MALQESSGESFDHIGKFLQSHTSKLPECFLLIDRFRDRTETSRSIILIGNSGLIAGVRVTYIENGVGREEILPDLTMDGFLKAVGSNRSRYKLFLIRIN